MLVSVVYIGDIRSWGGGLGVGVEGGGGLKTIILSGLIYIYFLNYPLSLSC